MRAGCFRWSFADRNHNHHINVFSFFIWYVPCVYVCVSYDREESECIHVGTKRLCSVAAANFILQYYVKTFEQVSADNYGCGFGMLYQLKQ